MKKYLWLFAAIIAAFSLVVVVSCGSKGDDDGDGDVAVTGVSITSTWDKIGLENDPFTMTASVTPTNATFTAADVTWTSEKPEFATVTGNGLSATVTAVGEGETKITVSVKGKDASKTITVVKDAVEPPENPIVVTPSDKPFKIKIDGGEIEISSAKLAGSGTPVITELGGKVVISITSWVVDGDDKKAVIQFNLADKADFSAYSAVKITFGSPELDGKSIDVLNGTYFKLLKSTVNDYYFVTGTDWANGVDDDPGLNMITSAFEFNGKPVEFSFTDHWKNWSAALAQATDIDRFEVETGGVGNWNNGGENIEPLYIYALELVK